MLLCSCDTGDTSAPPDNSPTATPKPIPQAVLGSTLKDFQAHFADSYFVNDQGSDIIYFLNPRNIFDFNAPAYDLYLLNGKVYSIQVLSNAHQQGEACAIFIPKDAKLISNTPNNNGAASAAMAIYHSNWLAPQFSPSTFVDQTNLTSSDQPQPLAKPGTLSLIWDYVSDFSSGCTISIGKNVE